MLSYPLQSPLMPSSLQHSLVAQPSHPTPSGFLHGTKLPWHKNPQCRQLHLYPGGGGAVGSIMQPSKTLPPTMHEQSPSTQNMEEIIEHTKSSYSNKFNFSISINYFTITTCVGCGGSNDCNYSHEK